MRSITRRADPAFEPVDHALLLDEREGRQVSTWKRSASSGCSFHVHSRHAQTGALLAREVRERGFPCGGPARSGRRRRRRVAGADRRVSSLTHLSPANGDSKPPDGRRGLHSPEMWEWYRIGLSLGLGIGLGGLLSALAAPAGARAGGRGVAAAGGAGVGLRDRRLARGGGRRMGGRARCSRRLGLRGRGAAARRDERRDRAPGRPRRSGARRARARPAVGYLEAVMLPALAARPGARRRALRGPAQPGARLRGRAQEADPDRDRRAHPRVFEDAVETGGAGLSFLAANGSYRRGVSTFPSLTPVCLSSIATGAHPDVTAFRTSSGTTAASGGLSSTAPRSRRSGPRARAARSSTRSST